MFSIKLFKASWCNNYFKPDILLFALFAALWSLPTSCLLHASPLKWQLIEYFGFKYKLFGTVQNNDSKANFQCLKNMFAKNADHWRLQLLTVKRSKSGYWS